MINFPIDLVFPYVDSTSKEWQKTYVDFCRKNGYKKRINNFNSERYRDWGFLRYMLRGVDKNLGFIRKVFLILQAPDQIPDWLNESSVEIVYHKDFIPEEYLPTYNSTTIEMFLDKIPGLSEHFIYANDDIYAMNPMTAEDFYTSDGKVKIGFRQRKLSDFMQFNIVCCNCFSQVQLVTGHRDTTPNYLTPFHEFVPMIKSHVTKIKELLDDKIYKNITPFRDAQNHNQYIYPYYELATNNVEMPTRTYAYINMENKVKEVTNIITQHAVHTLVLNDNEQTDVAVWQNGAPVRRAFESLFFKMSKFEKRPKVTIGIPAYNAQDYIADCLNSIPARDDIEVIIIDDCCTDNTRAIAVENIKRFVKYGVYSMNKNSGVAACRNALLDLANGDYIFFLDADDKVDAEVFDRIMNEELKDQNILVPKYVRNDGFSGYPTILRGCFLKLSYVGDVRHDNAKRCFEDVDFKGKLKNHHGGRLDETLSNLVVYHYNIPRVGSLTWNHWKERGVQGYKNEADWEKWFGGRPR